MVASSKLHRAQQDIERMRPYEQQLGRIMQSFVAGVGGEVDTPLAREREVRRVAILLFTSNSSLCGGFNANVVKAFRKKVEGYKAQGVEVVRVYAFGKKAVDAARGAGFAVNAALCDVLDHPSYARASEVAREVCGLYVGGEIDAADLLYHHFKSAGTQVLTDERYLPIRLATEEKDAAETGAEASLDFIVEPSREAVLEALIPRALSLKVFTSLLDSLASEHAARVIAMQMATDNADELLRALTLTYNKTRQQAITAELLDIVGGSMQ